mgnify:CR=1 FL=1|jgi:hypothetical protein
MVVFVYALLVFLLMGPSWGMLRILTGVVAVLVAVIALIDPIPMGLFPAVVIHSGVFFGLGSLIVWLAGAKSRAKSQTTEPPSQS